jgi:hypothetical protein
MAISLGFGVVFATAITLILIPTLYRILEDLKGTVLRRAVDDRLAYDTEVSLDRRGA